VTTPSKKKVEIPVKETPDAYNGVFTPTEVGPHKVDVTYGSAVVPKSPFTVDVTPGADLSKVKVTGLDTRKFHGTLIIINHLRVHWPREVIKSRMIFF
jgi:hypothetical protein